MCPGFVHVNILWKSLFWNFRLLLVLVLLLLMRLSALSAATSSLNDTRARTPATVTIAREGKDVQYAAIRDSSRTYPRPTECVGFCTLSAGDVHITLNDIGTLPQLQPSRQSESPTRRDFAPINTSPDIRFLAKASYQHAVIFLPPTRVSRDYCYLAKASHSDAVILLPQTHISRKSPSLQSEPPTRCDFSPNTCLPITAFSTKRAIHTL